MKPRFGLLLIGACAAASACADAPAESVAASDEAFTGNDCGGLPRLTTVQTPAGVCVGIVATGIPMARGIVEIGDGEFLVTSWASEADGSGAGSIWKLVRQNAGSYHAERLTKNVNHPHGIVRTETGAILVAEPGTIFRFDPARPDARVDLVTGMPDDGLHWATTLAYDSGYLYVNKGTATDNCGVRDAQGVHFSYPCGELSQRAQIRRYAVADPSHFTVVGAGLRNSVALTVHPSSHVVVQGENGQNDLNMSGPAEEINVLGAPSELAGVGGPKQIEGLHFGWPYCTGSGNVSPGFQGLKDTRGLAFDAQWCHARTRAPSLLLPPHSAPLGMAYVARSAFPFTGSLAVAFHGFASTGHKLVIIDADARGVPTGAEPRDLVWGWGGNPTTHVPMGKPVSVIEARDGALFVTDDRNGMILRVMCNPAQGSCQPSGNRTDVMPVDPQLSARCDDLAARAAAAPSNVMLSLQRNVIDPQCVTCHGNTLAQPGGFVMRACDAAGARAVLTGGSTPWVKPGDPAGSPILTTLELGMGNLSKEQLAQFRDWISRGAPAP